jgi:hypothetical protein
MNITKKATWLLTFTAIVAILCTGDSLQAQSSSGLERAEYYKTIASEDIDAINTKIDVLNKSDEKNKQAFEGALMMKRAGLLKGPSKKLKEFKAGKEKLESTISADANNAELRFLRLIIQEKAPGILGYNKELQSDHKYIVDNFKSLPEATQKVVKDYSKSSKVLSPSDF